MSNAKQTDAGAGLIRSLFGGSDDAGKAVAKAVTGTRPTATTRAAGSEETVSTAAGILQQLVMSDNPRDIQLLREMSRSMPPERFNALLVRSFRDPRSPADAPTLNHIGREILEVSGGAEPTLTKSADSLGDTGTSSVDIENATDLPEKAPPYKPTHDGKTIKPSDDSKFHVKDGFRTNKDGTTEVLTPKFNEETGRLEKADGGSASLDKQTAAAAVKAARGGTPQPISDSVAMRNSKPQQQSYNENLSRVLGLVSPQGVKKPISSDGGVPSSALKGAKPVRGRSAQSIGKTTAGDYETISNLLGALGLPVGLDGTTAQELATKIIAGADQGMFNATPLTAAKRREMTGVANYTSGDPKTSGPVLRALFPEESAGGTMAGRQASVQQAAIDTLARKIDELFSTGSTDLRVRAGDSPSAPSIELGASKLGGARKPTGGEPPVVTDKSPQIRPEQQVSGPAEAGDTLPVVRQLDDMKLPYSDTKPSPVVHEDGDFNKEVLRKEKARQQTQMGEEGVEYTARRPVEIQADIDAATHPEMSVEEYNNNPVIAALRAEMRQAMEVSSVMPKELRMAATSEGPAPIAPFKQGEVPDTPEDAAFQYLVDNDIGTHEERIEDLRNGTIVEKVARIRNHNNAYGYSSQSSSVIDPMQQNAQAAASQPAATVKQAPPPKAAPKPAAKPAADPAADPAAKQMTSEERIRLTNQFFQGIPVTATKETYPLRQGADFIAPYFIGGVGAKAAYDMYANRNGEPEQVQSGNETVGDPLSRRERLRAERQQKAGQP